MKDRRDSIQWGVLGGALLAAVLAVGCRTQTTGEIGPAFHSSSLNSTAPGGQPSVPGGVSRIDEAPVAVRPLNVAVATVADGDGADRVAEQVGKAVRGVLVRQGHTLKTTDPPDVRISLEIRTRLIDRLGKYYVYGGDVDAAVERSLDGLSLGRRQFAGKGERTLDRTPALQALARALSTETSQWLTQVFAQTATRIDAREITVKRAWKAGSDTGYARTFVSQVKDLSGVVSCQAVKQDYSSRTMVFRVVYFADRFPEGILNRIAGIPALNLKPRD